MSRYEVDIHGNKRVVRTNWFSTEERALSRGGLELKLIRKELCIVNKKSGFVYAKMDKTGVMHIKNTPRVWAAKEVRELISATLCTAWGYEVVPFLNRTYPYMTVYDIKCEENWSNRNYTMDRECDSVKFHPDGSIEGMREIRRRNGDTTSQW